MTIRHDGRIYAVPDLAGIVAGHAARIATGDAVPASCLLGCRRCKTVCVEDYACHCCREAGTKSPGGGNIHYPDDGKGHVTICAFSEFLAKVAA